MELSLTMKLRIAVSAALGILVLGYLAWPIIAPQDPAGVVRASNTTPAGTAVLVALSFAIGFGGYFLCWPWGREIAILAVPFGLAAWSIRSGSMAVLMQAHPSASQRQALYAAMAWEPLFWLALVAAGLAGVMVAQKLRPGAVRAEQPESSGSKSLVKAGIAVVATVMIAQLLIPILAQDVKMSDGRVGTVVGQPPVGQIVFAVLVAFGCAGFAVKSWLGLDYIWPCVAAAMVNGVAMIITLRADVLAYMARTWPAAIYCNSTLAILPVQMVCFGVLGSIAGYWLAVRYDFWRTYEMNGSAR